MNKKFADLIPVLSEKDYRELPHISQSLLVRYNEIGPAAFRDKKEEIQHFKFGSLVDAMLTEPDTVEEKFYIKKNKEVLSDALEKIISRLAEEYCDTYCILSEIPEENVIDVVRTLELYSNYKDATILQKIYTENCSIEYVDCILSKNKIIISQEDFDEAQRRIVSAKNIEIFSNIFLDEHPKEIEVLFQVKLIDDPKDLKGMLDILYIDHHKKQIRIIDIKTTRFNSYEFNMVFKKFRYDIQAEIYVYLLRRYLSQTAFRDYEILPFSYFVLAPDMSIFAEYDENNQDLTGEWYKWHKRWPELYEQVKWHKENKIFDITREIFDNNRILQIKI